MKASNNIENVSMGLKASSSSDDANLWSAFKMDDEDAFKTIYFSHYDGLFQYAMKICNDDTLCADAIQDLFSELWISRKKLGDVISIRAYLFSSVRRRVMIKLKANRQKQVIALEMVTRSPDIEFSTEMIRIREESLSLKRLVIKDVLNDLPKRQKEVIYLRFYQELSYTEIAEVMNMKYQSVQNLFGRALTKLRENPVLLNSFK